MSCSRPVAFGRWRKSGTTSEPLFFLCSNPSISYGIRQSNPTILRSEASGPLPFDKGMPLTAQLQEQFESLCEGILRRRQRSLRHVASLRSSRSRSAIAPGARWFFRYEITLRRDCDFAGTPHTITRASRVGACCRCAVAWIGKPCGFAAVAGFPRNER